MRRCFVALELAQEVRQALGTALAPLARAARADKPRLLEPGALHVTLEFLGSVEQRRVQALTPALADAVAGFAPMTTSWAGFGGLPRRARAHVLVAVLRDEPGLLGQLQQSVTRATSSLGFPEASRPFKPHATLARFRNAVDVRPYLPLLQIPRGPVVLTHVVLYESELAPGGARYSALQRFPLAGTG